jgi:division protein CdvB (Snf7/Vps24/ESCRT-III family)
MEPPPPLPAPDLPEIEAQARYHRDRLALYRARLQSARPASTVHLRELQQASEAADERLRHARRPAGA